MSEALKLIDELDALDESRVVRAKTLMRDGSKARAGLALAQALKKLTWSNRELANYVGVDEKTIRAWIAGHQQPAWIPLAMPREGYIEYLRALAKDAPPESAGGRRGY